MSKQEYNMIIKEIVHNKIYLQLKNYTQHNESIYDHSLKVSYLAYKISKKLKLDYISATRGALLHDFFLYDWRIEGKLNKKKLFQKHGFTHPKEALINAKKHFNINKKEEDIIIKHMFPLTICPPIYLESWVVTLSDKYISIIEILNL
ncbi:MAG: HD domain-containing protein [Bacillota bacterium]|nr:HD domain-containing protein [Bacillota bacterium]